MEPCTCRQGHSVLQGHESSSPSPPGTSTSRVTAAPRPRHPSCRRHTRSPSCPGSPLRPHLLAGTGALAKAGPEVAGPSGGKHPSACPAAKQEALGQTYLFTCSLVPSLESEQGTQAGGGGCQNPAVLDQGASITWNHAFDCLHPAEVLDSK